MMISGRKISNHASSGGARRSRATIRTIALAVTTFFVWSAYAPLEEIVRGVGQVVPAMQNQVIQNLEGGIIKEIYVVEGDVVEAGATIVKLDETQFESAFQELQEQRLALLLKLERLRAERTHTMDFKPSEKLVQKAPQYADSERELFLARRAEYTSAIRNLEEAMRLKNEEVAILRPMAAQSAIPQIELVRAEQEVVEIKSRISAAKGEFETRRSQEYADSYIELRQIEEKIRSRKDQLRRTSVETPVKGVVNKVMATTIGGVARPGDPLVEILPLDEKLRIEGRVDPKDIGFVFIGMPATVKLTAFDFSIYGTLSGQVVHVGADTVVDETVQDPKPYYEVYIELKEISLNGPAGPVSIRPGMQAAIELESGQKTVLKYILKPLFKTTEALTER